MHNLYILCNLFIYFIYNMFFVGNTVIMDIDKFLVFREKGTWRRENGNWRRVIGNWKRVSGWWNLVGGEWWLEKWNLVKGTWSFTERSYWTLFYKFYGYINEHFDTSSMSDVAYHALITFAEIDLDISYLNEVNEELEKLKHWLLQLHYLYNKMK